MNVRLTDQEELNNFLTYGKWDLDQKQIERLKKDEEMKQRVREGDRDTASWDRMDCITCRVTNRVCKTSC